jgi:hypothetical protein
MKSWEIIADNLKKRGWNLGYVSAVDSQGRTFSQVFQRAVFFFRTGFIQILSPWQARITTVQVWTVVEGFGIGSEIRQTRCAANNFRDHQVLFRWFQVLQSVAHLLDLRCLLFQSRS